MVEKIAEKNVCENCQADVRLNALFCYNCGSQVATDEEVAAESQNEENAGTAGSNETIGESKTSESSPGKRKKTRTADSLKRDAKVTPRQDRVKRQDRTKDGVSQPEVLRTAASIKRGPNPLLRKKVEVTWAPPDSASNFWFLIVSIILIAFSLLVLFIMLYIK